MLIHSVVTDVAGGRKVWPSELNVSVFSDVYLKKKLKY